MAADKVLRKNPDIVSRVIEDETILLPIYKKSEEIDCIYTLNEAASFVWSNINGKNSTGQIKKKILKKFGASDDEADKGLNRILKEFKKIRAVS
ncbi:MAG: PqqD family protein [Candidatus Omnitrophica bacterium]|nr:PqqD family protein [Candidatus Omnitrophota bacterium]